MHLAGVILYLLSTVEVRRQHGILGKFVLYDHTSDITSVNDSRKYFFMFKSRSLENLLPTQEALRQHVKCATYQTACWKKAPILVQDLPDPANCWEPLWTTSPKACHELIHCGCKKGYTRQCKCMKTALKCTALCFCQGECQ